MKTTLSLSGGKDSTFLLLELIRRGTPPDECVFFDTGWEKNRYWNKTYHSYGVEISADTHFFRLPFPVNIGFRTGYETKSNSMFVDMLFSVAFTI